MERFNPNSEVGWQLRAYLTTETLSTTEGTDFAWTNVQSTFPCFINTVSELSGSQCFSGFPAGIYESTSDFGLNRKVAKAAKGTQSGFFKMILLSMILPPDFAEDFFAESFTAESLKTWVVGWR